MVTILGERADATVRVAIDLRSDAVRQRRYEAGSAIARCYEYDSTFTDDQLKRDLGQFWPLRSTAFPYNEATLVLSKVD
jgi:hypothetical protein